MQNLKDQADEGLGIFGWPRKATDAHIYSGR